MCTCIWLAPVAPHALHYSAAPASACEQYSHYKKKKKIGPKSGPVKTGPTGPVATALKFPCSPVLIAMIFFSCRDKS